MRLVRLGAASELPPEGALQEFLVEGRQLCVARNKGKLFAISNVCPHRGGPMAEGMLEDGKVLCPWHAWAFDLKTGALDHDPAQTIAIYPLQEQDGEVLVDLGE